VVVNSGIANACTGKEGFEAACCEAGIKYKDSTDMALVFSKKPCGSAGTFTSNVVKAACVQWDQKLVASGDPLHAVVVNSGIARINLTKRHPGTLKLVHMLPAAFTLGVIVLLLASLFWVYALIPLLFYALLIFCGATIQEKSLLVGVLAIPAAFVQLGGYGLGFLWAWWRRCIMREGEFGAFKKNFYK
jgi:hypothetical protein